LLTPCNLKRRQFRRTVRTADNVRLEKEAVEVDRKIADTVQHEEAVQADSMKRRQFTRTVRTADTVQLEKEAVQADSKNC